VLQALGTTHTGFGWPSTNGHEELGYEGLEDNRRLSKMDELEGMTYVIRPNRQTLKPHADEFLQNCTIDHEIILILLLKTFTVSLHLLQFIPVA
jgi:hypothetical protein